MSKGGAMVLLLVVKVPGENEWIPPSLAPLKGEEVGVGIARRKGFASEYVPPST